MNSPIGDYAPWLCYIQSGGGEMHAFRDERALERFVMACRHVQTMAARNGYEYCVRCWAMPRKAVKA